MEGYLISLVPVSVWIFRRSLDLLQLLLKLENLTPFIRPLCFLCHFNCQNCGTETLTWPSVQHIHVWVCLHDDDDVKSNWCFCCNSLIQWFIQWLFWTWVYTKRISSLSSLFQVSNMSWFEQRLCVLKQQSSKQILTLFFAVDWLTAYDFVSMKHSQNYTRLHWSIMPCLLSPAGSKNSEWGL